MTDELVTIVVDGQELKAKPGSMLIDVTDAAGISIPRFCYHKKLSVSANCRMCLVEVDQVPKPLPACATPIRDGMTVFTKSPMARAAQKGTMEFLLINHPLDCPICDQGGECELQDVALAYGSDASRYVESKRAMPDPDIGPLVATGMTRCIHCTRCVRFGAEIAGMREMGATGRNEHMTIGTYVQKSIDSELSGNIIDLCPVGALTSKPFRFQARAWETRAYPGIAPHDALGSNLDIHVRRNQVLRVVPRDNEALNECWLSDRDRFGYEALHAKSRLLKPLAKENGEWRPIEWADALERAATWLKSAGAETATLISPRATLEELYLAQKLTRGLGSQRIDSRPQQLDFRNDSLPSLRWLGMPVADLATLDAVLVIGGNPRKDQPLLGHRLRKAAMVGATVDYLNPCGFELNYAAEQTLVAPAVMVKSLAGVAKALGVSGALTNEAADDAALLAIAERLKAGQRVGVFLGAIAESHPDYAVLETLAWQIAQAVHGRFGHFQSAANAVGAQLAGAMPHRLPGGAVAESSAQSLWQEKPAAALLVGVDPLLDAANPAQAREALAESNQVVALTAFRTPTLAATADLMLPIGWFAETSGTLVNTQGDWQSFSGAVTPAGEARPAWKVLRVLGTMLDIEGFEYDSSEEVLAEVRAACDGVSLNNDANGGCEITCYGAEGLHRLGWFPLYAAEMGIRQATALQKTRDALGAQTVQMNAKTAAAHGLSEATEATVIQNGGSLTLPLCLDETLADDCVLVAAGIAGTEALGPLFGELTLGEG